MPLLLANSQGLRETNSMSTYEKCEGCPRLQELRDEHIPTFQERITELTGVGVEAVSLPLGQANPYPNSVRLVDGSSVSEDMIIVEWSSVCSEREAHNTELRDFTSGCTGMTDAVVNLGEKLVTIQVCGRTVLDAAQEANPTV